MEIILLENILNLGNIGDKVVVKPGYGRNYLLKTGKALRYSKENLEHVSKKKDELNKKNVELKKKLKETAKLINKKSFKFNKSCPFSVKNAPIIDYKNIALLKKYISENNKILSSKITAVSSGKQKKLTKEIKRAKILGLI